jgi:hypothetical protein
LTDAQRRYWQDRRNRWQSGTKVTSTTSVAPRENWSGFSRNRTRVDSNNVVTTRTYTQRSRQRSSDDGDRPRRNRDND